MVHSWRLHFYEETIPTHSRSHRTGYYIWRLRDLLLLGAFTREGRDKRTGKTMVQKGVDAVLEEQTEQMCLGITDAEAIASAYVDAIRSEAADSAPTQRPRNAEKRQRRIAVVLPRIIKNRIRRRKDDK